MRKMMMAAAGLAIISGAISSPQEKPITIRLGQQVEVGQKELLLGSIASVCEDGQANFYVLDRLEHKVFKFSPEGRLLAKFGQKGQGPGDFQTPSQVVLTSQGELAVLEDLYYVSFLTPDGGFIRRLDLNGRLGLGFIGPARFYGFVWRPEDRQQVMVDDKNNILRTFHAIAKDQFSVSLPDETGRAVAFNYSHEAYVPQFLYAHGGQLSAVGISDRYEIVLLDEQGQTVKTIRRDMKPQRISGEEQSFLERGLQEFAESKGWPRRVARELGKKIPSFKNMVKAVHISPEHVFVFRFPQDITAKAPLFPVDIFTLKGEFRGKAELPEVPLLVTGKAVYFVKTDESANLYLLRARYSLEF